MDGLMPNAVHAVSEDLRREFVPCVQRAEDNGRTGRKMRGRLWALVKESRKDQKSNDRGTNRRDAIGKPRERRARNCTFSQDFFSRLFLSSAYYFSKAKYCCLKPDGLDLVNIRSFRPCKASCSVAFVLLASINQLLQIWKLTGVQAAPVSSCAKKDSAPKNDVT